MSDLYDRIKSTVAALRGKAKKMTTENPDNPNLKPLEQRRDGYRTYRQLAAAEGSEVLPYEEWIKQER
jgi:hypothetical protein